MLRRIAIRVYVNSTEYADIQTKAAEYGMSVSAYLRVVGVNPDLSRGVTRSRLGAFRRYSKQREAAEQISLALTP
jgi:hypothetical protein